MAMKLIKANVSRNVDLIDEVITDLTYIRWGFQKAIEIQSGITSVEDVMQEHAQRQEVINNNGDLNINAGQTTI